MVFTTTREKHLRILFVNSQPRRYAYGCKYSNRTLLKEGGTLE